MVWDRRKIIEEVTRKADKYGSANTQQRQQLLFACKKSTDRELFFGLFSLFYDKELQENYIERQHIAGYLLFELKPSCPIELEAMVYAVQNFWDYSVEEIPWYMCHIFGKETVIKFLREITPSVEDYIVRRSFETLLFWAGNYKRAIT